MEAQITWKSLSATFQMARDEIMFVSIGTVGTVLGGLGFATIIQMIVG